MKITKGNKVKMRNLLDKKDVILKDIKKLVKDIDKLDNETKVTFGYLYILYEYQNM